MNKYSTLTVLRFVLCISAFLGGSYIPSIAQDCIANAGNLELEQSLVCPGEVFQVDILDYNSSTDFSTELIITNTEGVILFTSLEIGLLPGLAAGSYRIHAINYQNDNPPKNPPQIGQTLGNIEDEAENCFDIGAARTLTVGDDVAPQAVCTQETILLFLDKDGLIGLSPTDFDFGSFDEGCSGIVDFSLDRTVFDCNSLGKQSIALTVTDTGGLESVCNTMIEILDNIAPKAICLEPTIYLNQSGVASLTISQISASTDNCSLGFQVIDQTLFNCEDLGIQTLRLRIGDDADNLAECNAILEVKDTLDPVAFCRRDANVYLGQDGLGSLSAVQINLGSSDNCGKISRISLDRTNFSCSDLGPQRLIFTAFDPSGNFDTCHVRLLVQDTFPPLAKCQDTTVVLDELGMASIDPTFINANSTDNCSGLLQLQLSQTDFDCSNLGIQTLKLYVSDAFNNLDSCEAILELKDTTAPVAICRPFTVYTNSKGLAVLKADSINAGSFDLCTKVSLVGLSKNRFNCSEIGPNLVRLFVEDIFNNRDSCTSLISILDTIPPQIFCKKAIVYIDQTGKGFLNPEDVDDGSIDNCGLIENLSLSQSVFDCQELGSTIITLQGMDPQENLAQCTSTLTLLDTIRPQARCQDFELVLGSDGEAILTPDLVNNQSSDNCGITKLDLDKTAFNCSNLGVNFVLLKVFDKSENVDTCRSTLMVVDRTSPQVFTQNIQAFLDRDGAVEVDPQAVNDGSRDNCSIDSLWLSQQLFDCSDIGAKLLSLFVRDIDGNIEEEAVVITIRDTITPVFICPPSTIVETNLDGLGSCSVVLFDQRFDPQLIKENCALSLVRHDFSSAPFDSTLVGAELTVGKHLINWVVEDKNGNTRNCSFELNIVDSELPIAKCLDTVFVQLEGNGFKKMPATFFSSNNADNCKIESFVLTQSEFDCSDVGFSTVSLTVGDAAGNKSTCFSVLGVIASEACTLPLLSNKNGPNISDPCTCRGNGSFDEEVVIGPGTKNQVWTVKTSSLLDPNTLTPLEVGTHFTEIPITPDSSIYVLQGVHLDGEGYQITAQSPNFNQELSIGNLCAYPDPQLIGFDGPICLFTDPIDLNTLIENPVEGSGRFFINGTETSTLYPMQLGPGDHELIYAFDAGDPASMNEPMNVGCAVEIRRSFEILETPRNLACNNLVNVFANGSCEIEISPQLLLNGNYLCYDDYQVFIGFGNQSVPNPVPAEFVGEILRAIVQHKTSGNICEGSIKLIDVEGPQFTSCPDHILDRFFCTDLDSILNNPQTLDSDHPLFTGIPSFEDNCTGTSLRFQDFLETNSTCTNGPLAIIRRVFTASDQFDNSSTCEQLIYFQRPVDIIFPGDTLINEDCTLPPLALDQAGNLSPEVSGIPFIINGFGDAVTLLDRNVCGYLLSYTDLLQSLCPSQFILLRTWRLFDECNSTNSKTVLQSIRFGDFSAPVLSCPQIDQDHNGESDGVLLFSTNPFGCTADIQIPTPEVQECSEYEVDTRVYTWLKEDRFGFPLSDSIFSEIPGITYEGDRVKDLPVGDHFFLFTVRDECGNTSRDTCAFVVADKVPPVAFCESNLTISLAAAEGSRIYPRDIDQGSRDNCDDQNLIMNIRRFIVEECSDTTAAYTPWGPFIEVNCCDLGKLVNLELQLIDQSGNINTCNSRVLIEDKQAPSCSPPFSLNVDCDQIPIGFDPEDLEVLQQNFGQPTVLDNCGATWSENPPVIELNSCNIGTITRSFKAVDLAGNISRQRCEQLITLSPAHAYQIKFPADAQSICGMVSSDTLEIREIACDLLAVSVQDVIFNVVPEGCFKIERLFKVINWCEYDGISSATIISRDVDCNGVAGDQEVWLTREQSDTVFLDVDDDPRNEFPKEDTKGRSCDGQTNPEGYWFSTEERPDLVSNGYWQYTQFVSVYDEEAPEVSFIDPGPFCVLNNSCNTELRFPFRITENCSPNNLEINISVDINADNIVDFILSPADLIGNYPNYRIEGTFEIGKHQFMLEIGDGCGNVRSTNLPFEVLDCQVAAPICSNGLIVELSRLELPEDIDADGFLDLAFGQIEAVSFIASPGEDCSGSLFYSINRVGESPNILRDTLLLTCFDEGIVPLEIYAWDALGNRDFCQTFLEVQNNQDACREIPRGAIFGTVTTEMEIPVRNVEVQLSGFQQNMSMTGDFGTFGFEELEEGSDYTVTPYLEGNYRAGVSTFDLILIRQHILGIRLLKSPFKILAADANSSKNVSILDIILLQKLILGLDIKLSNSPSWKFVDAGFSFPDPEDPWKTPIPGVINLNNLEREFGAANFIAIKTGDVNDSVDPLSDRTVGFRKEDKPLSFHTEIRPLLGKNRIQVRVFAEDLKQISGYQFALEFQQDQARMEQFHFGQIDPSHFGLFPDEGLITHNWFRKGQELNTQEPLFAIDFELTEGASIEQVINLSQRVLAPEGYSLTGKLLPVSFLLKGEDLSSNSSKLYQNYPNPFAAETDVVLFLEKAQQGRFSVYDQNGVLLRQEESVYPAGRTVFHFSSRDFPSGLLFYRFEGEGFSGSCKMLHLGQL